jgi:hypothetical protein
MNGVLVAGVSVTEQLDDEDPLIELLDDQMFTDVPLISHSLGVSTPNLHPLTKPYVVQMHKSGRKR